MGVVGHSPPHSPARPPAVEATGAAEARAHRTTNQGPPRRDAQARAAPGTQPALHRSPLPPRASSSSAREELKGRRLIHTIAASTKSPAGQSLTVWLPLCRTARPPPHAVVLKASRC
ncbi:hypothetical protein NDU88_005014 [Pleurodeles waltl]|uniref:Uncharacterized protein n=1 Tax=Pleurodeles waltl TaxID=8319 RepID=A0AAV7V574_PLEWA|nr:hypothetical protein NDU88_005014 [Pleurodeles waltl]